MKCGPGKREFRIIHPVSGKHGNPVYINIMVKTLKPDNLLR